MLNDCPAASAISLDACAEGGRQYYFPEMPEFVPLAYRMGDIQYPLPRQVALCEP